MQFVISKECLPPPGSSRRPVTASHPFLQFKLLGLCPVKQSLSLMRIPIPKTQQCCLLPNTAPQTPAGTNNVPLFCTTLYPDHYTTIFVILSLPLLQRCRLPNRAADSMPGCAPLTVPPHLCIVL